MGNIKIQDTGYIRSDNSGTQSATSARANDGDAIVLKASQFSPNIKKNVVAKPDLASSVPSQVDTGSLENMQFSLKCVFRKDSSSDMATVANIIEAVTSDTYKLLWYDYSNASDEKNASSLLYQVARNPLFGDQLTAGEQAAFSISAAFYTLHVQFTDIQQVDSGKSGFVRYDIKGVVDKVRSSVI